MNRVVSRAAIVAILFATGPLSQAEAATGSSGLLTEWASGVADGSPFLTGGLSEAYADTTPITPVSFRQPAPQWTAWAGAIFLTRSSPSSITLISDGAAEIFNAGDFNFGTAAGPDINVIRHGTNFDLGFRYFQVNNISARRTIIPGAPAQLEFSTPLFLGGDILGQLYTTSLLSVELNLRRNVSSNLTLLAGFRYLSLDDDLRTRFDLPTDLFPAIDANVDGINRLYGGQIGADGVLWAVERFELQSAVKAGVFGNAARNGARLSTPGLGTASYGTRGGAVAFVGDLNFTGVVHLTETWSLRGGYQLLWISGLALSSDQFPYVNHSFIPDARVVTSGDLFLHGALVGVQAAW